MPNAVNISSQKWVTFGLCWMLFLVISTVATLVATPKAQPPNPPDGPQSTPPAVQPAERGQKVAEHIIRFNTASKDNVLDAGELEAAVEELRTNHYKVVIVGLAKVAAQADRDLAAGRAEFIKGHLLSSGLGDRILSNDLCVGESQSGVRLEFMERKN